MAVGVRFGGRFWPNEANKCFVFFIYDFWKPISPHGFLCHGGGESTGLSANLALILSCAYKVSIRTDGGLLLAAGK